MFRLYEFLMGRRELLMTSDEKLYYRTVEELKAGGIKISRYARSVNSWDGRQKYVFGEAKGNDMKYYIFVKRKDYEKAAHILSEIYRYL